MPKQPQTSLPGAWISELFRSAAREISERRVGIEVERIGLWLDGTSWSYSDKANAKGKKLPGAKQLLQNLSKQNGWSLITSEKNCPLGLNTPKGKVSLEPGSQVEFSSEPMKNIFEIQDAVDDFEKKAAAAIECKELSWVTLGVNPLSTMEDIELIPSTRYRIMTDYLGKRARLGTSMMRRTSSVQINLDYTTEDEAICMLRTSLAAAPISYALFANSPFLEGKETGYLSYRYAIWQETDPDRSGLLPEAFSEGFNFDAYAESLWRRPLMFAQNKKNLFIPANGISLEAISQGKLENAPLSENNQWNGIRELFTEARLKPGYVEIRSVDGETAEDRYASTAFWLGLLYDKSARELAMKLLGKISTNDREKLLEESARKGLRAEYAGIQLKNVTEQLLEAADDSLKGRKFGEEKFLAPLWQNVKEGVTPAEKVLKNYHGSWNKNILKVIEHCRQAL